MPKKLKLSTTSTSLTVTENAGPTPIDIVSPSDSNYSASQLTITVTGLPTDGTVFLADGVTPVTAGETLTVAQLTGLVFKPTSGLFGQSSTFTYKVTDPSGARATGTATLAIGPDVLPPTTVTASLTVAENAAATPIGIAAPSDPNYAASQLTITVTGLPKDGTVFLADGVTPITAGETLTVAQLTGLVVKPTSGLFGQSSTFTYKVTDPSGLSATGTAILAIGPDVLPPTTVTASLTVAENAVATPIGIAAPTDPNYAASQLTVAVTGLPSDGTVWLSDGVTRVSVGQTLSVAALTSLLFAPTANLSSGSSTFSYTVSDPAGLSAAGSATLAIDPPAGGISPDGSTLLAGSSGSLVTSAGTWTFSTATATGGYVILLNGQPAGNGAAVELEVANQGNMYADNNAGTWYEWTNSNWVQTTSPSSTTTIITTTTTTTGTISPDGSTLTAGSGGSLVTSAGTWTFSTATTTGGNIILLNGQPAGNGGAVQLEVANQGNLYAYNNLGTWYEWFSSGWAQTTSPTSTTTTTTTTSTTSTTTGTISPGGSTLLPGSSGSLTTSAGTWALGAEPAPPDNLGGYAILLNGQPASGGQAVELQVANGGNLYAFSGSGLWYEWTNGSWTSLNFGVQPPLPIATTTASLGVVGNSGATPIGIATPTDPGYSASQLTVTIRALPTDGTIFLSDGVTTVTAGETLSVAQLTGLEFRPTANLFNKNSVLNYTVTDPAGNTANGNAWVSVGGNPSAVWQDPPSGAKPASGTDIAPTVVQPSQGGDIVGVQLQNTGTTTEASGYVSFGMVFLDGALSPGTSLVARINGVNYFVQMNVESTYSDGSIKHAILTLDTPAISVGGTLDLMLAKGSAVAPVPAAPTSASALLASGYNVNANFTFNNSNGTTTTDSASAGAALQAALAAGTVQQWLAGPGVNEYIVKTTVDGGKLKVSFDIRAYADGTTTTDVIFDNSWMFSSGKTDLNYNVSISQGGTQVYSASNIQQYLYSMWDHQVASAGTIKPNIQYDVAYLEATGAIQAYDTSYGVSDGGIQYNYNSLNATNTGPMGTGTVDTAMPGTGGRQDIGLQPNWTAQWLLSQNADSFAVMTADANASGSVPWHFTDESTGKPVNVQTYPNFTIGDTGAQYLQPANGWPSYGTNGDPWTPDPAHMPDLNYVPYLVTGSYYQLQLLQSEADFAIASTLNDNPLNSTNQIRGLAWELRTIAEAASLSPDSDSMKSYYTSELDTVMAGLVQSYVVGNVNGPYGELKGMLSTNNAYTPTVGNQWAWQDDYVVTSLAEIAGMNIPQASADALELMQYMDNFVAGLFTNGPNGFNPIAGTPYGLGLNDPTTGAPLTTWSQLFKVNSNSGWYQGQSGNGSAMPTNPTEFINYPTQTMGGYGELARAALADEITYTQSPQAIQAYGLVVSQIAYAFMLDPNDSWSDGSGAGQASAYQNYPQFSVMPRLPDGIYLNASQMQVDTSNAATVNLSGASGRDVLLAVVGSGTTTLTSNSAAGGNALLYGGSGKTTLVAGAGNDYMFGGGSGSSYMYQPINGNYSANGSTTLQFGPQQMTTFVDGTGNDYMYGGPGPNNYNFRVNSVGPRATTIANFNLSTDQLQVAANLDGNGITSASQLLAGATGSNGNTVLHLSPNDNITLLGINTPSSLLNSILVS